MDVAWVVRGGADPLDWLGRYKGRVTAAHVKDIAPKGENAAEDGGPTWAMALSAGAAFCPRCAPPACSTL